MFLKDFRQIFRNNSYSVILSYQLEDRRGCKKNFDLNRRSREFLKCLLKISENIDS